MKDNLRSYLLPCRRPRVVQNRSGRLVSVSCGRCRECMARKSARNTVDCIQDTSEHTYTFFITLTYNDVNVPTLMLKPFEQDNEHFIKFIDLTKRRIHPKNKKSKFRKSSTYGKEFFRIKKSFKDKLFQKFYRRSHKKSKYFKAKPFPYFAVLSKEDLQKFFKRLRFSLRKDFDAEIRYFACGEYGPDTFRPHYHIILSFDEYKLLTVLEDYVSKCWQYGRIDCEPARTRNGVASYAASYCNGSANLPSFLNHKSICPFVVHSSQMGNLSNKEICKYVRAFDQYSFDTFTISTSFGFRDINLSSKIKSYLFPRCYDYEYQVSWLSSKFHFSSREESIYLRHNKFNISEFKNTSFYKLYNLYPLLSSHFDNYVLSDLTRYFLLFYEDLHYLLDIPELDYSQYELPISEIDDFHIKIYNKVYNSLRISKRVFENAEISELSFVDYLFKIIDFYNQLSQHQLKRQYEFMEEFAHRFSTNNFHLFYSIGKDLLTDTDKYVTSPDLVSSYNEAYRYRFLHDDIMKQFINDSTIEISNKIKHKELNDANLIFTQL